MTGNVPSSFTLSERGGGVNAHQKTGGPWRPHLHTDLCRCQTETASSGAFPVKPQNAQMAICAPSGSATKEGLVQPEQVTTSKQGRSPLPTQTRGSQPIGAAKVRLVLLSQRVGQPGAHHAPAIGPQQSRKVTPALLPSDALRLQPMIKRRAIGGFRWQDRIREVLVVVVAFCQQVV